MVNSNDFNFNYVICLVAHTKLKFFFFFGGGGIFESHWSCIVPLAFKGFLQVLWILRIFRAVWKTVRTIRQHESEESAHKFWADPLLVYSYKVTQSGYYREWGKYPNFAMRFK